MRPDRKERAAEDAHEEEEEEDKRRRNTRSLVYFFRIVQVQKQMSHPPLISRFANDAIVSRCNGLVVRYTDEGHHWGYLRFANYVIRSSREWLEGS